MSRAILRLAAIAAASTGSMLLAAAPALAYPYEIGTKSCATNYHVAAKTRGAGRCTRGFTSVLFMPMRAALETFITPTRLGHGRIFSGKLAHSTTTTMDSLVATASTSSVLRRKYIR